MTDIPSLKGLRAFEAAARTGSFVAAARELSVSAAAISQLIRSLENQLGHKLFHRINRGITPTEAGLEVLPRISAAFEELVGVSRQISGIQPRPRLSVSAPLSVVAGWLSEHIAEFTAIHGSIDICLRSDDDPVAFERDLIDIRMSYGRFHYRAHDTEEIVIDAVYPVCSPGFITRHGPFTSADNLFGVSLIHTDWGPASATFPAWSNWFEAACLSPGYQVDHGIVANSSVVAVNLAINGLGVALCQGLLAVHLIERGLLVRAFDLALPQNQPYCLTIPQRSASRPIVYEFRDWIVETCKRTVNSSSLVEE